MTTGAKSSALDGLKSIEVARGLGERVRELQRLPSK